MPLVVGGLEDDGCSKGWDQFHHNEIKFGVVTTYDENQYTTRLDPDNANISKEAAERLAQLVQNTPASILSAHLAEERGQEIGQVCCRLCRSRLLLSLSTLPVTLWSLL